MVSAVMLEVAHFYGVFCFPLSTTQSEVLVANGIARLLVAKCRDLAVNAVGVNIHATSQYFSISLCRHRPCSTPQGTAAFWNDAVQCGTHVHFARTYCLHIQYQK